MPSFKEYLGPVELLPHVSFKRNGTHFCIYCGEKSDTREHSPSKVFLRKPYPEDLRVLPACKKCNNGFSDDELYAEVYFDAMKYISGYSDCINKENNERIYKNTAFMDVQRDFSAYCKGEKLPSNARISRVLSKLAVCHCTYELSEGYYADLWEADASSARYAFAFELSEKERRTFTEWIPMMDKKVPIIGSRVFDNLFVVELVTQEDRENNLQFGPLVFMAWTNVQEGEYEYVAWIENDQTMRVRIVIHNFVYAEILFRERET